MQKNIFKEEKELEQLYNKITNPTIVWESQSEFWEEFETVKDTVSLKTIKRLINQTKEGEWYETTAKLISLKILILDLSSILTGYNELFNQLDLHNHKLLLNEDDFTISKISESISNSTAVFKLLHESKRLSSI